jgi:catechol 2,3-dioxygenase-like lactoylglutathione lyase family enzyme
MRLNQVTLGSSELGRSKRFYQALGLRLIVDDEHYMRFECPDGDATFSVELVGEVMPEEQITVYFECDDVDAELERLRAAGIEFEHPADVDALVVARSAPARPRRASPVPLPRGEAPPLPALARRPGIGTRGEGAGFPACARH